MNRNTWSTIVTGAGRGIGRATALALAAEGHQVLVAARSLADVQEVAREIQAAGGEALAVSCDVRDIQQVNRMVEAAITTWGRVDLLVNNAGFACFKPFEKLSLEDWEETFAVNLLGTVRCIQAVLPHMTQQRSGRIINLSSVSGLKGIEEQSAYCASKHAVNGLTKALALELRSHNIAVHALCPGAVATRLAMDAMPGRDFNDWMTPDQVAQSVLYLANLPEGATVDILHLRRFGSSPL